VSLKIIVVSDTHGSTDLLDRVIEECSPFDVIVHCGDGVKDICNADVPHDTIILKVTGNTDMYSNCGAENILTEEISDRRVMITHGHQFNVKGGFSELTSIAGKFKADVVLFGHTHEQLLRHGNPLLFNPGNLSGGNYGIIHASDDKEWMFEHRKIKKGVIN
jgi:putative phosphoesterase